MFNVVKIGDTDVPMLAMASTDIYYKRVFGRDAIAAQADSKSDGELISFYGEMGFIMAQMAAANGDRAKLNALNFDSYVEWLDSFAVSDYHAAITDIAKIYEGQKKATSNPKKEVAR